MELKNSEHYNDPTPYEAHKNIRKEEQLEAARMRTISALVGALKQVADLAGFEIVGRVVLMDKDSGRIFRRPARSVRCVEGRLKTRRTASGSARSAPRSVRPKPSTDTIWRTASIMPNGARNSPPAENRAALRSCWQGSRGRSNHRSTRLNR